METALGYQTTQNSLLTSPINVRDRGFSTPFTGCVEVLWCLLSLFLKYTVASVRVCVMSAGLETTGLPLSACLSICAASSLILEEACKTKWPLYSWCLAPTGTHSGAFPNVWKSWSLLPVLSSGGWWKLKGQIILISHTGPEATVQLCRGGSRWLGWTVNLQLPLLSSPPFPQVVF